VHSSKMIPEIIRSAKAHASLSFASILGTVNRPFLVDFLDMTIQGFEVSTTVWALNRTGSCRWSYYVPILELGQQSIQREIRLFADSFNLHPGLGSCYIFAFAIAEHADICLCSKIFA